MALVRTMLTATAFVVGCGPDVHGGDRIAISRSTSFDEHQSNSHVLIVDRAGAVMRTFPELRSTEPSAMLGPFRQAWVDWSPTGDAAYVANHGMVWRVDDAGTHPLRCGDEPSCAGQQAAVLHSGRVVVGKELPLGAGYAPLPKSKLLLLEREPDQGALLATASEYVDLHAGGRERFAAVEVDTWFDDDAGEYRSARRVVLYDGEGRQEPASESAWTPPSSSPSGDLLAWTTSTDEEASIVVETWADARVASVPGHSVAGWSRDSRVLAGGLSETMWALDVETDRYVEFAPPNASGEPFLAPDGMLVAVFAACGPRENASASKEIVVLELWPTPTEVHREPCRPDAGYQVWWAPDSRAFAIHETVDGVQGFAVMNLDDGERGPFIEGVVHGFRPDDPDP